MRGRGFGRWLWVGLVWMATGCGAGPEEGDVPEATPTPPDETASSPSPAETETPTSPEGETTPGPTESPVETPSPVSPTPSPTPGARLVCPAGMSPVTGVDPSDIRFCIDTYEVITIGNLGSANQYLLGAEPTTATTFSIGGQIPSVLVSYDQAAAACENTLVFSSDGTLVGTKRLATSSEWQDAADGVVGKGGSKFIYGSSFDETACATLLEDGTQVYYSLQPTGSLERCVSPFGVFDQSGNAWEWADPGRNISISSWFALVEANGFEVSVDGEGLLYTTMPGISSNFRIEVAGVQPNTLAQDGDGYLYVPAAQVNRSVPQHKGYLKLHLNEGYNDEPNFLPVDLRPVDEEDLSLPWMMYLLVDEDGAPIPDKRGGAFYTGTPIDCATTGSQMVHFHDFSGTIGFRCACDPLLETP